MYVVCDFQIQLCYSKGLVQNKTIASNFKLVSVIETVVFYGITVSLMMNRMPTNIFSNFYKICDMSSVIFVALLIIGSGLFGVW